MSESQEKKRNALFCTQTKHLFLVPETNFPPILCNLLSRFEIFCSLTNTQSNKQKQNLLGRGNKELLQSYEYVCKVDAFTRHILSVNTVLVRSVEDPADWPHLGSEPAQMPQWETTTDSQEEEDGTRVIHDWINCHRRNSGRIHQVRLCQITTQTSFYYRTGETFWPEGHILINLVYKEAWIGVIFFLFDIILQVLRRLKVHGKKSIKWVRLNNHRYWMIIFPFKDAQPTWAYKTCITIKCERKQKNRKQIHNTVHMCQAQ